MQVKERRDICPSQMTVIRKPTAVTIRTYRESDKQISPHDLQRMITSVPADNRYYTIK